MTLKEFVTKTKTERHRARETVRLSDCEPATM